MNDATNTSSATPARTLADIPPVPGSGSTPRRTQEPTAPSPRGGDLRMTVGPGIRVKGEIADCNTLVVEGTVEATLASDMLEIAESGSFEGTATISNAEIHGQFEGELNVSGLLHVHGTGRVSGTIRYGRIEVASGGEISGTIGRADAEQPGGQSALQKTAAS